MSGDDANGCRHRPTLGATAEAHESLDTAFRLVSNRLRRYVLYHLVASDGVSELEDVVDHVMDLEAKAGESTHQRRTVVTALEHNHLPQLAETGVIDYDRRSGTIRYYDYPILEELVDLTAEFEPSGPDEIDSH